MAIEAEANNARESRKKSRENAKLVEFPFDESPVDDVCRVPIGEPDGEVPAKEKIYSYIKYNIYSSSNIKLIRTWNFNLIYIYIYSRLDFGLALTIAAASRGCFNAASIGESQCLSLINVDTERRSATLKYLTQAFWLRTHHSSKLRAARRGW